MIASVGSFAPHIAKRLVSLDSTVKLRHLSPEGISYESCILSLPYRSVPKVICVSTQLGCPFDCSFCEIGAAPHIRNLSSDEIAGQVNAALADALWASGSQPFEVAAMGTGEPLCALNEVLSAVRTLKRDLPDLVSLNVATVGVPHQVRKYALTRLPGIALRLQLSLHATSDLQRSRIMPRAARYQISSILSACEEFAKQQDSPIVVNYLLLAKINDSLEDARRLAALLNPAYFSIKLSLPNPTSWSSIRAANQEVVAMFLSVLEASGLQSRFFASAGVDIGAGCGQFANVPISQPYSQ